jgi:23S rRNA (guanosine2251-2'-O)-methyltransferase
MLIYGIHACREALNSQRNRILQVYILNSKPAPNWVSWKISEKIIHISPNEMQKMLPKNAVHQGIVVELEQTQQRDIGELSSVPTNYVIAMLDNVTDPQNLGAIIRTAATFGIGGIILTEHSSCKITGTVIKTASGGLEHVSVYTVKNLANAIEKLKSYGFWIVTCCERGDKYLHEIDLSGKTCVIFGSEEHGVRKLQKELSDFIAKLPTNEKFPTLNVAASAAIVFYEIAKQNNFKL